MITKILHEYNIQFLCSILWSEIILLLDCEQILCINFMMILIVFRKYNIITCKCNEYAGDKYILLYPIVSSLLC